MRLHVVGLVHTQTTTAYNVCAFTGNTRKFARMMVERGHKVFLYAGEHAQSGAELVTCITEERQAALGFTGPETILSVDYLNLAQWAGFLTRVIAEIRERIEPTDVICLPMGNPTMAPIVDAFPNHRRVEHTAGYAGIDRRNYAVWPSHAWENFVAGNRGWDPTGWDTVIPHAVEPPQITGIIKPDDYFMWIGRYARKGREIAIQVAEELRVPLKIAGPHGMNREERRATTCDIESVGIMGPRKRDNLLSRAQALFVPTQYVGPFELVFAEALMCGTPVITSDFGSFTEYVEQGVDGFRCRTIPEYVQAAKDVGSLNRVLIAKRARERFSPNVVAPQYERYLEWLVDTLPT